MINKRGQGMSIETLILIIIGIIVLVILILGFTMGWQKVLPWLSSNNVDTIVTQCQASCTTSSQYGFCLQNRSVNDGTNPVFNATCLQLSANSKYGVSSCSQVQC